MTLEEKIGKTLDELGIVGEAGVRALFAGVRAAMEAERQALVSHGAATDAERQKLAKSLRDRWLARKGGVLALVDEHWLRPSPKAMKPVVGREFNQLRQAAACVETKELARHIHLRVGPQAITAVAAQVATSGDEQIPAGSQHGPPEESDWLPVPPAPASPYQPLYLPDAQDVPPAFQFSSPDDLTLPGNRRPLGSIHPIMRVQREIEDIFLDLGFSIETGPEIESVYYNFDALNIPESHPSRDDWDSLYIDANTVLRTHTSPVQMRAMEKHGAPLYIIAPGKCYRRDNPDATHSPMFHQIEGLAVDTDITFADLKGTLDFFAKKFFGSEKVRTRFNPSFFPFTEPSGEVSVSCPFCDGGGCRRCKESGWIELLGCGMVHPEVLRYGGIDPDRYSGWAFGLGIDRFAMVKYDITDIQLFFQGDVRFLEQF